MFSLQLTQGHSDVSLKSSSSSSCQCRLGDVQQLVLDDDLSGLLVPALLPLHHGLGLAAELHVLAGVEQDLPLEVALVLLILKSDVRVNRQ